MDTEALLEQGDLLRKKAKESPDVKYLMVLADGTTFSELNGCMILCVSGDWDESDLMHPYKNEMVAHFEHEAPDMTPTVTLPARRMDSGQATFPLEVEKYVNTDEQAILFGQ